MTRSYDRAADQARPVECVPDFVPPASGSALIAVGRTQVICTASVEPGVPLAPDFFVPAEPPPPPGVEISQVSLTDLELPAQKLS